MSDFFLALFVAALGIAVIQQFFKHSRSSRRRIYWGCTIVGAGAAFLMVNPDWKKGFAIALGCLAIMTVVAYANTPYIKIRGKVYALTVQDSQPDPDDDSDVTAATTTQERDPAPDAYSGLLSAT